MSGPNMMLYSVSPLKSFSDLGASFRPLESGEARRGAARAGGRGGGPVLGVCQAGAHEVEGNSLM